MTANHVDVQPAHTLQGIASVVNDQAESALAHAFLFSDLAGGNHAVSNDLSVLEVRAHVSHRLLRDHQNVLRSNRAIGSNEQKSVNRRRKGVPKVFSKVVVPDVVESEASIVLINDLGRNGLIDNLGEDGILRLHLKGRSRDVLLVVRHEAFRDWRALATANEGLVELSTRGFTRKVGDS